MLSRGDLSDAQLRHALEAQRRSGSGRIGEWMRKLGYVGEHQVTAALGAQCACPVLRRLPATLGASAIPLPLLRAFHMVPVHYTPATRVLFVAFARDIEYHALLAIEHILECVAKPCLAVPTALRSILEQLEEGHRGSDIDFEHASSSDEMCRITSSYASNAGAEEVRLTRCGDYIWVRIQARRDSINLIFSQAHSRPLLFEASPSVEPLRVC